MDGAVVVTGGASGLGRALTAKYAGQGDSARAGRRREAGIGRGAAAADRAGARGSGPGLGVVRLGTPQALTEAAHMHRTSGHAQNSQYGHDTHTHSWFEKRLSPARPPRAPAVQPDPRPALPPSPNSAGPAALRAGE